MSFLSKIVEKIIKTWMVTYTNKYKFFRIYYELRKLLLLNNKNCSNLKTPFVFSLNLQSIRLCYPQHLIERLNNEGFRGRTNWTWGYEN